MKKITVRACVGILLLFMASIFLRFFTLKFLIERFNMNNAFVRTVFFDQPNFVSKDTKINWAALYPFENSGTNPVKPVARRNTLERVKDKIFAIEDKIEKYTSDNLVVQPYFAETAVKYEKAIGWNLHETIYDLGGGFFTEIVDFYDTDISAVSVAEFHDFLSGLGIDFLYVQAPHKINGEDPISGTVDFSNQNADRFLRALASENIPFLDLRECIKQENLDHHSLFYKTDHHWKAETGLWAAGVIAGYLNERHGFGIDLGLFKPEQYRSDLYEQRFLGSVGKKLTRERASPEDFTLLYPTFDTDYSLQITSKGINRKGSFDILYDLRYVVRRDYYGLSSYNAHLYGGNPLTVIRNNRASNNKKILLVKDSFGRCAAPFLSTGIKSLELLDLRHFNGSIKSYVKETKPDMVIVMYNPSMLDGDSDKMFSFR